MNKKISLERKEKIKTYLNWKYIVLFFLVLLGSVWMYWLLNDYKIDHQYLPDQQAVNLSFDEYRYPLKVDTLHHNGRFYIDSTTSRWKGDFITFLPFSAPIENRKIPLIKKDRKKLKELYIQIFVEELNINSPSIERLNSILNLTRTGYQIKEITYEIFPNTIILNESLKNLYNGLLNSGVIKNKTTTIFTIFEQSAYDQRTHTKRYNSNHAIIKGNRYVLEWDFLFIHELIHHLSPVKDSNLFHFIHHDSTLICNNTNMHIMGQDFVDLGCHRFLKPYEITFLHALYPTQEQNEIYFPLPKNEEQKCCTRAALSDYQLTKADAKLNQNILNNEENPLDKIYNQNLWADYQKIQSDTYSLNNEYKKMLRTNHSTTYDMFFKDLHLSKKINLSKEQYIKERISYHIDLHKYNVALLMAHKLYQEDVKSLTNSLPNYDLHTWRSLNLSQLGNHFNTQFIVKQAAPDYDPVVTPVKNESFTIIYDSINYSIHKIRYKDKNVSFNNDFFNVDIPLDEPSPNFEIRYTYRGFNLKQTCIANGKNNIYLMPCNNIRYNFKIPDGKMLLSIKRDQVQVRYKPLLSNVNNNVYYFDQPLESTDNLVFKVTPSNLNPFTMQVDKSRSLGTYKNGECTILLELKK